MWAYVLVLVAYHCYQSQVRFSLNLSAVSADYLTTCSCTCTKFLYTHLIGNPAYRCRSRELCSSLTQLLCKAKAQQLDKRKQCGYYQSRDCLCDCCAHARASHTAVILANRLNSSSIDLNQASLLSKHLNSSFVGLCHSHMIDSFHQST
jgi:hypothetical protein